MSVAHLVGRETETLRILLDEDVDRPSARIKVVGVGGGGGNAVNRMVQAGLGDVEFIVWELVQNQFISSSSRLAETIQSHVTRDLGLPDRGVRQAGFRVLVGAYMPAVLIELGFLSHRDEEQRLGDSRYQRELAAAIGDAILAYRDENGLLEAPQTGADEAPTGDTGSGGR